MKTFGEVDRSAFRWLRDPADTPTFRLLAGDDLVARMQWAKSYGSLALAETTEGISTIKRNGFLSPHVTIRDPDGNDSARLDLHFTTSRLTTKGGASFLLRRRGLLLPAWQVTRANRDAVAHIEAVSERGRLMGGTAAVEAGARETAELAVVLLLAWYYVVQLWIEEEAGAATSAALIATS